MILAAEGKGYTVLLAVIIACVVAGIITWIAISAKELDLMKKQLDVMKKQLDVMKYDSCMQFKDNDPYLTGTHPCDNLRDIAARA